MRKCDLLISATISVADQMRSRTRAHGRTASGAGGGDHRREQVRAKPACFVSLSARVTRRFAISANASRLTPCRNRKAQWPGAEKRPGFRSMSTVSLSPTVCGPGAIPVPGDPEAQRFVSAVDRSRKRHAGNRRCADACVYAPKDWPE